MFISRRVAILGFAASFGLTGNQGMDEVFLTVIQKDGSFKAIKSLNGRGS